MTYLEELIGQPLDKMSDEELEHAIMTGRVAREGEASERGGKKAKATKTPAPAKVAELEIELDLDDMPD